MKANSDGQEPSIGPREIAAQADAALATVRIILGVLSVFVIGAYRPLTDSSSLPWLALTLAMIAASVVLLNWAFRLMPSGPVWAAIAQALDIVAIVALAVALDEPLDQRSWVLLLVPVVSAAVRLGVAASLLSWIGGCAGYLAAAAFGAIDLRVDFALVTRVPGTLLAVAITVSVLARWMREGWEIQNRLTAAVAAREHRLSVLERTRHAVTGLEEEPAIELCAGQALALGFEAVTVHHLDEQRPTRSLGRAEIVAAISPSQHRSEDGPVMTVWTENGAARSFSAAVYESHTNSLVTGWSDRPIEHDQAQALAALVSDTSAAIETTTLLARLRHSAEHDALTGLTNRGAFDRRLSELARTPGRLVVAFIDLDNFKQINDTHGHDIGDKTLVTVANRLRSVVGSRGWLARYGGDEFVAVFPDLSHRDACAFAAAALRAMADPLRVASATLQVGVSIGVAGADTPVHAAVLLEAADRALYEAKRSGKSGYRAVELTNERSVDPRRSAASTG